ncbi:hypothetical protein ACFYY2_07595 [Streptomyces sp. NPDC001822]|uniref:hypothetical protein n=1 Tax=Streptomyces sp. NPDC001822 TaxID=3364614 RepID=UPI00369A937B
MITIICGECTRAPFGIAPDGLFQCDHCRHSLDLRDIDLDGSDVWCVDSAGTLGYVVDPAASLTAMSEALEEWLYATEPAVLHYASLSLRDALTDLRAAMCAGLPFPSHA